MLINDPGMVGVMGITRPVEEMIPEFTSPTATTWGSVFAGEGEETNGAYRELSRLTVIVLEEGIPMT